MIAWIVFAGLRRFSEFQNLEQKINQCAAAEEDDAETYGKAAVTL